MEKQLGLISLLEERSLFLGEKGRNEMFLFPGSRWLIESTNAENNAMEKEKLIKISS